MSIGVESRVQQAVCGGRGMVAEEEARRRGGYTEEARLV